MKESILNRLKCPYEASRGLFVLLEVLFQVLYFMNL